MGALTTIGVAWGAAAFGDCRYRPGQFVGGHLSPDVRFAEEWDFGVRCLTTSRQPALDRQLTAPPAWSKSRDFLGGSVIIQEIVAGFPFHALYARAEHHSRRVRVHERFGRNPRRSRHHGALFIASHPPENLGDHQILPCIPLLRGFLLNSVLAGAVWFLAFALAPGIALVRQRRRRRRACCTRCGYPLAKSQSEICPECGPSADTPPVVGGRLSILCGFVTVLCSLLLIVTAILLGRAALPTMPPLHQASQANNPATLQRLLEQGTDPNLPYRCADVRVTGMTALMAGARTNAVEAIELLLKAGADPSATTANGLTTALSLAIDHDSREAAQALINSGSLDVNPRRSNDEGTIGLVLERWGDDLETVELLVAAGLRVTLDASFRYPPLVVAIDKDCPKVQSYLVAQGAEVADPCRLSWALYGAVRRDDLASTRFLLQLGADPTCGEAEGVHPLLSLEGPAVGKAARAYLEAGGSVHMPKHPYAIMYHTAVYEMPTVMRLLIEFGADVNVLGPGGKTPLIYAVTGKTVDWVVTEIEPRNSRHESSPEALEIARLLLDAGADINHVDNTGKTALLHAAERLDDSMCRLLLDAGADASICDNEGLSALDHARMSTAPDLALESLIQASLDSASTSAVREDG